MSEFRSLIETVDVRSDVSGFSRLVACSLREAGMSFREAADYLQTAPAMVEMWANRTTAPTPGIRQHIVERLAEMHSQRSFQTSPVEDVDLLPGYQQPAR